MGERNSAIKTYKYFSTLDGNQHIASEFALVYINNLISKFQLTSVLELGLGIGAICYSVQEYCERENIKINYVGTEANQFCLNVLPKYLKSHYNTLKVYPNLEKIPADKTFDLVIIDGQEENLDKVKNLLSKHGTVLIEGDRLPQLEIIRKIFPKAIYVRVISLHKNPKYGPYTSENWCGGVQLIFIDPTFNQKVYYLKTKIATSIKYKLRKIL